MKTFTFFRSAAAVLVAAAFLTGCDKEVTGGQNQEPAPVVNIDEESSQLQIPYEGGEGYIEFYVSNPANDGSVAATVDADNSEWVTGLSVDETNGRVSFTVAANEAEETRTAVITITYSYGGDQTAQKSASVVQEAAPAPDPFSFTIDNVTHNTLNVTVTPVDQTIDYLVMAISETEWEMGYASDEQMYQMAMETFAAEAAELGYTSMPDYFENEDVLYKGTSKVEITGLAAETAYRVFAIGTTFDMHMLTPLEFAQFTTTEAPQQGVTFEFAYNNDGFSLTVTPSDETVRYYTEATFTSALNDLDPETWVLNYWASTLAAYTGEPYNYTIEETVERTCSTGTQQTWLYGEGEYIVFAHTVDLETGIATDVAYRKCSMSSSGEFTWMD